MKLLLLLSGMIGSMVVANLLMKLGATSSGWQPVAGGPVLNWFVTGGLATSLVAAAFYVMVLAMIPLNVAQSFVAAQYVAVVFAANLALGEPIGSVRWLGIALIAGGITIVGWTR